MNSIHRFISRPKLIFGLFTLLLVGLFVFYSRPAQVSQAQPPIIGGCQIFPADNVWNVPITNLPVDPNSATYINTIGANRGLHPDFGSGTDSNGVMYGIPSIVIPSNQAGVPVTFDYNDESDPGPGGWLDPPDNTTTNYPIPPTAPIEGGPNSSGDRHILMVQQGTCKLYETFSSYSNGGGTSWDAGSGAIFNLNSNALRPDTWTSADAAGLPILAGLARYDEYASTGAINHALRFTVQCANGKVWPARHLTSNCSAGHAPMGQRFRLKASYVIPANFSPQTKAILQALKTYGMIVADNGSNWFISGEPNANWDDDSLVPQLAAVKGSNFEAVDSSGLMKDPDSGQAAVAPTSAPSGLAVSVISSSQLNLSWTNTAPNTTGYRIERSLSPSSGFSQIATTLVGVTTYLSTGLADGTPYYFRVRAYNTYGNSAYSNVDTKTTPWLAPTSLAAAVFSPNQINLSWNDNSSGESGYYIERKIGSGGTFAVVATTLSNINSYQDKALVDGTDYYYRVRAFNSTGNSAYSNQPNTTTLLAPPTSLLVWASAANQLKLQWLDNSQSEEGYFIERSPDGSTGWAQVGTMTASNVTTFTDNSVPSPTLPYYYRVRAFKNPAYSGYSGIVSAIATVLQVTIASDNGLGNTANTLSFALAQVSPGQTILILTNVVINSGANWSPNIPAGINLVGNCGVSGPTISIDGINTTPATTGLVLNQTTIIGLKVWRFNGVQIKTAGTGNKLVCTQAIR